MTARTKPTATFCPLPGGIKRRGAAIRVSALAVGATFALAVPGARAATGFQPLDLRVDGGEESWHAEPTFALRWTDPPGVAAVHYRVLDPSGQVTLVEARIGWAATAIQQLAVPQYFRRLRQPRSGWRTPRVTKGTRSPHGCASTKTGPAMSIRFPPAAGSPAAAFP